MRQVKQRLITTPTTTELIEFQTPISKTNPIVRNKDGRNGNTIHTLTPEEQEQAHLEYRQRTINRQSANLWRTHQANANQYKERDKFMTLTTRIPELDISKIDYQFKKMIIKLRRLTKADFQYQAVRELQERGALHYHILFYGLPFVPHMKLLELWNKSNPYMNEEKASGVNIKGIKEGLNDMTNYLTSYQLKALLENLDFLKGRRTVLRSKNLKQPIITEFEEVQIVPLAEDIKKGVTFIDSNVTYYRFK